MPRYFFDIVNSGPTEDDTGTECATFAEMRKLAMQTLPEIARDEILSDGDRQVFTVVARDEKGIPVYAATLSFVGLRLLREA